MIQYPDDMLPSLRFQHCPLCRAKLVPRRDANDGIMRSCCPDCNWIHYPANAIGVNLLIRVRQNIVVIYPPGDPAGSIAFPGGHVEYGESPIEAAIREAYEETGFQVEICHALGWYFQKNQSPYPGPIISFMFVCDVIGGEMKNSEEGRVGIVPLEKLPQISPKRTGSIQLLETYLVFLAHGANKSEQ
jgi:8-oxo-dGTP pyrophosphatase MutT (NUDIX family)